MKKTESSGRERPRSAGPQIGEPLAARARSMLEAALRVLDRDGADKLTVRSVAREANETPSLVLYYFSSMDRLEAMLLDSLWHDFDVEFLASIGSMPQDAARRVDALVDFHSSIAAEPNRYRQYFGLVSGVVTKPAARAEIAGIYRAYRSELNVPLLAQESLPAADTEALAALVLAVAEGLPFWHLVTGEAVDPRHGFALLRRLLKRRLGVAVPPDDEDDMAKEAEVLDGAEADPPVHRTATRLLEAGHAILQSTGLRGLSFENIARVSGEARPAVGYHFGNKRGFVDALCIDVLRRWRTAIDNPRLWERFLAGAGTSDVAQELHSVTTEMIQVFPAIQRNTAAYDAAKVALTTARAMLTEHMRRPGDTSGCKGSPVVAADLCIAAITGVTLQRMYDPDGFDQLPILDQLVALLR